MVVYEFYIFDKREEIHSIGILPERRRDPLRITRDSVMKWGKMVAGDDVEVNNLYFVQSEV